MFASVAQVVVQVVVLGVSPAKAGVSPAEAGVGPGKAGVISKAIKIVVFYNVCCSRGGWTLLQRWLDFVPEVAGLCSRGGWTLLQKWLDSIVKYEVSRTKSKGLDSKSKGLVSKSKGLGSKSKGLGSEYEGSYSDIGQGHFWVG